MPNTGGVTFGNISIGYPYATPNAQITYRSPVSNGFQLAVGVLDPDNGEGAVDHDADPLTPAVRNADKARFEGELTYATEFDGGKFNAWIGAAAGDSNVDGGSVEGLAFGARINMGGFQLTASGFDQEGISSVLADRTVASNVESDGYLVQASYSANGHRIVLSHGETDTNAASENELDSIAYFYNVNSNLILVAEYDMYDSSANNDTDQFAIGAVITY
jgi:hypothetical protein